MDQARHELVHGISSLIGRPTNLGLTATDHPHIKHTSAKMTLDTYADLFDDDLDAVAVTLHSRYSDGCVQNVLTAPDEGC
jgi:hypothetical protein